MNAASAFELRRYAGPIAIVFLVLAINLTGLVDPMMYHDEAITIQLASGDAVPDWPDEADRAGTLAALAFEGSASPASVVSDLYQLDVHPPVYFLLVSAWGWLFGHSLEVFRAFSVLAMAVAGLALRAMLQRLGHPGPTLSSLLFVSFSSVVIVAQSARPYSLNLAILCLTGWALAASADRPSKWLAAACAAGCSLAFLTSYLALFPVAVLLLAYLIVTWKHSRWQTLRVPALTAASWLPWWDFVARQSGARPEQAAGFLGWPSQLVAVWEAYEALVWFSGFLLRSLVVGVLVLLVIVALRRRDEDTLTEDAGTPEETPEEAPDPASASPKPLGMWLLLGWTLAPAVGMVAMNVIFDKQLTSVRYLVYAAPAVAGLLGYAFAKFRWLRFALPVWIAAQIFIVASYNDLANPSRRVSEIIKPSESTLVIVSAGLGLDGFIGQVIYELDPDVKVFPLYSTDALETLRTRKFALDWASDIWLLATPESTSGLENPAFQWLIGTGEYRVESANPVLCHLVRKKPD